MRYFLDADTCIFALKGKYPSIKAKMHRLSPDNIKIPAMVKAELLLGARKSRQSSKVLTIVDEFLLPFEILPFCSHAAQSYAEIRETLEKQGNIIGPNDLIIAATVKFNQGILITHNLKEFKRVPGLKVEDWVK